MRRSRLLGALVVDVTPNFKVERIRDPRYVADLHECPCCIPGCRRGPIHAHHLICSLDAKARGLKASDIWCLPLCLYHHTALHAAGNERRWWETMGIDPIAFCRHYWKGWLARVPGRNWWPGATD